MSRSTNQWARWRSRAGGLLIGLWSGVQISAAEPKQGAELLKVDVMAVLAHPDDETGMASALATLALIEKATIANVYCTRGEGGGNMVGTHWGPSLGILREAELRDCLERVGIRYCFFLDQRDWAYTESRAATLRAWNQEEALERLVRFIRVMRPTILLTMDPTPRPGQHGHHQSAGILATEAFVAAADPDRFPDQIHREGLSRWQPRKLYALGSLSEYGVEISPTRSVGGERIAEIVGEALSHHRSQGFGRMRGAPWLGRPRWFSLLKTVIGFRKEASFFEGLPIDGAMPSVLPSPGQKRVTSERKLGARLVPRPAITRYEQWVGQVDLEHILLDLIPDVPVVIGAWNGIEVEVHNPFPESKEGVIELSGSDPLTLEPARFARLFPPGVSSLRVRAKPAELGDHSLEIVSTVGGSVTSSTGLLHTVPVGAIRRVARLPILRGPELKGTDHGLAIRPEQRVQGTINGPSDSRARVEVLHDGHSLLVEVRVWDEMVVSNIAVNDVRGHWRSDAVEICIDPVGGSEDSFNCFKLGIIPFVEEGGARGARDADANQGPLEETAPETQIASQRLDDGYRVRTIIPFSEAGIHDRKGTMIGFNVIVYDGDKADAAIGENINESRIAWAPRSGVQGRPEDWGRLQLQ